ncbi:hypothetical protein ACODG7_16770 [Vibrio anguillarum]|uniref:Uncharacterized protein n=1 Tax=Vibrio anguillarum TaxID=55601 RepID=A0A289GFQ2_VIBAN|nr:MULTISPECIES: hypothetical protein [Vibrio]ASW82837.1 hypothetical protein CK207_17560 [Vibrio anguillarum]AZS27016.1 hypothetical protein DYL72_19005 [Vibrio anguillarum]MBF4308341.1 hypothetical protein [Vibrio anguillarum]MBF4326613.1 hypothetical protein [Vibrio anguillarum]RMZ63845.1 hypothetical protein D9U34_11230 [Vibrio anguillarum]
MLGGRLDAEGYFADEFTAINNPTRLRNNKYVMIIHLLKFSHENMEFTVQFQLDLADKTHFA